MDDFTTHPPRIGNYQIIREVGRGGMGVVYEAREQNLARRVALKVILGINRANQQVIDRFRREAASAARLSHPNIVQIYAYGEADGQHFIAMEFVDGSPLERLIRGRQDSSAVRTSIDGTGSGSEATVRLRTDALSGAERNGPGPSLAVCGDPSGTAVRERRALDRFVNILIAAARGLHAAHEAGLLHRDVKPANILVGGDDVVKIADFGLARMEAPGDTLTKSGEVMGTLAYMSPEQLSAQRMAISRRSDIYALGVTLYEILAGRRPFDESSTHLMIQRIQQDDPLPPSRYCDAVPRALEIICLKAMERDPEHRYATAAEFADDLEHYLKDEPIMARSAGTMTRLIKFMRRRRVAVGVSALALVSAIVISMLIVQGAARDREVARAKLETSLMRSLGGQPADVIPLLDEAQRLDPKLVDVYLQRGLLLFNTDQPARALEDFERGLKIEPGDPSLRFARGTVLRFMGREAEAREVLANARIDAVDDPVRLMALGIFLVTNGRARDAATAFEKAKEINPTWPQSRFGLALASFRLRRWEKTKEILHSFLDLDPKNVVGRLVMVSVLNSQLRAADGYERTEIMKTAEGELEAVRRLAPDEPLLGSIGAALAILDTSPEGTKKFQVLLRDVEDRIKALPPDRVRVSGNIVFEALAQTVVERDPELARRYAEQALKIRKGSDGARFVLARIAENQERLPEAVEMYRALVKDYPQAPLAIWRLLAIRVQKPDLVSKAEAEELVDALFEIDAEDPEIVFTVAEASAQLQYRVQQARGLFDRASALFRRLGNEKRSGDARAAQARLAE